MEISTTEDRPLGFIATSGNDIASDTVSQPRRTEITTAPLRSHKNSHWVSGDTKNGFPFKSILSRGERIICL